MDRTLFSRYELKYWLPARLLPEVRAHLRPFCRPDRFARVRVGNQYTIGSLYLDNPAFDLYRSTFEGHHNRFKLRIRAYDDDPSSPVFCEIKKRSNQVVRKRRAMVSRDVVARFLAGEAVETVSIDFREFVQAARRIGARPAIRVRYQREAYESRTGDPVRVTMDSAVMHVPTVSSSLAVGGPGWQTTPTEGLILEAKFTDRAPSWVTGMIRSLGLERTSIPKYALSLEEVMSLRGRGPWNGPRRAQM